MRGEEGIGMAKHGMGRTGNDRISSGNGLCAGRRESEWAEQGMTERGMTDYYCSLNK
jgi:hypothetical protein